MLMTAIRPAAVSDANSVFDRVDTEVCFDYVDMHT